MLVHMNNPDPITRLKVALEGRYRIESELGEGGMATVYLADDLKHGRKVALKVLKPELAAVVGAERFLAEINTTANLTHPNILPLHDSGEVESFLFYVMPYVEGETLRDRLDREHQLPIDDAVRIASDVAEALQYAHGHGVIHRDIKPANILLQAGRPLIADFGIALALSEGGGHRLTETGLSLGTPHYMSPEQATGDQGVGPATDIYALGCVLYEMLVGEPPFTGSTPQAILGKIITGDVPSAKGGRRAVPTNVDAAISKALEMVPADRFGSVQKLRDALAESSFQHRPAGEARTHPSNSSWLKVATGLAVVSLSLATALIWSLGRSDPPVHVQRHELSRLADDHGPSSDFEFGPAGSGYVYNSTQSGGERMYRGWSDVTSRPITGAEGGFVYVSPDGAYILEDSNGEIRVIPLAGGAVRKLVTRGRPRPRWGADGYIYFTGEDSTIHRISELLDGAEEPLGIERSPDEGPHFGFRPLPGGEAGVFQVGTRIEAYHLASGRRTILTEGIEPTPTNTGHLVWGTRDGLIMAATLDPETLELGPPVSVIEGVALVGSNALNWSLASDGTLGYWETTGANDEMVWVTGEGASTPVISGWSFDGGGPGWGLSPDNTKIAYTSASGGTSDIWIKDLTSGTERSLTQWDGAERDPTWVSDSTVQFLSRGDRPGGRGLAIYRMLSDGSGEPELHYEPPIGISRALASPDDSWIVLRTSGNASNLGDRDLLAVHPASDSEPSALLTNRDYAEHGPAISPDGRWLAYSSNESGRDEVSVRPFPDTDSGREAISAGGGMSPFWSPDGTELFYVTADLRMMAVRVSTDPTFERLATEELFQLGPEYLVDPVVRIAQVANDGRFLMMRTRSGLSNLVLIENWFEELKRLVPN
jgi:eukaryotic-like serine/threonine-protein kinase